MKVFVQESEGAPLEEIDAYVSRNSGENTDDGTDRALEASITYKGYYDSTEDKFYTDNTKETELPKDVKSLYIDITVEPNLQYQWNGTNFKQIGGAGNTSWSDIQSKPFNTIGSGLKVDSNALKVDVVDNLDSSDATKPLSAKQGSNLVNYIDGSITNTLDYVEQQDQSEHDGRVAGDNLLQNQINNKSKVEANYLVKNGTILIDTTQTMVYDDTEIRQALAGFNKSFVINDESAITGTKDATTGDYSNVTAITGITLSELKLGDNIFIKNTNQPDFWVSQVSPSVSLTVLDTKIDLSNYYNKTQTDALLANKADVSDLDEKADAFEEITLSGTSGTLTEEQLAKIQANPYTTILVISSYQYRCIYISSATYYFQRTITFTNAYISITVSSRAWSLTTTTLQNTGNLEPSSISTSTSKYPSSYAVSIALGNKQDKLTSGTNIKTLNQETLLGNGDISIPIGYYTCDTASTTVAKVGVWVSGAKYTSSWLPVGAIAVVKFVNSNGASNPTLNLNSSGAKAMMQYGTTTIGTSTATTGYYANSINIFTYDGTNWVRNQGFNTNTTYTIPYTTAYCATSASTAAKTASCTGYVATANTYTIVTFTTANSYAGAITLNINTQGAKTIYINGTISSSSNYTLPAGTYIVYYTGTYYYLRTDGRFPYLNNNVNTSYGISVDSTQRFYIVQASSSEISSMSGSYKPITPSTLTYVQQYVPMNLQFQTTAPTSANSYGLKGVYLTSEPSTKYSGYLYFIKE